MENTVWLKRFLDAKRRLLTHPVFDCVRHRLYAENLWHLNRRSFAGGLACGLFAAFIPVPLQMLLAALLATFASVNLPIALVATWVSNPLTYAPIFYTNYRYGALIISWWSGSPLTAIDPTQGMLTQLQAIGAPFLLGSFCAGLTAAAIGYIGARAIWRAQVLWRRWRRSERQ